MMCIPSRRSGEIGIRTRLKIWRGSLLMSVRVRPPAPFHPQERDRDLPLFSFQRFNGVSSSAGKVMMAF